MARHRRGSFSRGQILAQLDSAKSVFDFEAPCSGMVMRVMRQEGETAPLVEPVLEIETSDPAMREWIPPAAGRDPQAGARPLPRWPVGGRATRSRRGRGHPGRGRLSAVTRGHECRTGERLPRTDRPIRLQGHRHSPATLGRRRRAAFRHGLQAALEAIRNSGLDTRDIDAIIVSTTTPDMAIPSTAAILQGASVCPPCRPSISMPHAAAGCMPWRTPVG